METPALIPRPERTLTFEAALDIDVYRPTLNSLNRLWPKLVPGGLIVLDDCRIENDGTKVTNTKFSGGHQALLDLAPSVRVTPNYVADKLAIIRKPLSD